MLEKVATIKVFECSPLGSELKKKTSVLGKNNTEDQTRFMNLIKKGSYDERINKEEAW